MKGKMLKTTNKRFEYLLGIEGDINISRQIYVEYIHDGWFHTSDIKNIEYKYSDGMVVIIVTTFNSCYEFELLV